MKRIQLFSIRDMPENLQEEVREYFKNELSHIVEYYPLYKDKDIEEKKRILIKQFGNI